MFPFACFGDISAATGGNPAKRSENSAESAVKNLLKYATSYGQTVRQQQKLHKLLFALQFCPRHDGRHCLMGGRCSVRGVGVEGGSLFMAIAIPQLQFVNCNCIAMATADKDCVQSRPKPGSKSSRKSKTSATCSYFIFECPLLLISV